MIPPKLMRMPLRVFNVAFDLLVTGKVNKEELDKLTPEEIAEYDFVRVLKNSSNDSLVIDIAREDLLYEEK